MNRAIGKACHVLEALIGLLLLVMVVLVFGNVALRYAFNSGITVSEEVSRWMFVWLTFLGAIVALQQHGHLGSDMLISRLPDGGKRIAMVCGHVLMLYITWLLFSGSLQQARINFDVRAPVTGASVASHDWCRAVADLVLPGEVRETRPGAAQEHDGDSAVIA